jgi:demethylmenaquinone methyltransferase/2-methoxy-6-polyprenyl-1,4-benzoquinol methylase
MKGAQPAGARSEQEAARWVSGMFARVAPRYDLANHLLSFNIDRYWRSYTVRRVRPVLQRPGARVLDLCCGTGDLTLALERGVEQAGPPLGPPAGSGQTRLAGESACPTLRPDLSLDLPLGPQGAVLLGSDFCHPMLVAANEKMRRRSSHAALFEADALNLPLADASVDLVTVAFGFRNLVNYEAGLAEMRRLLRPGGMAAILEFSQPPNPAFRALYNFYSRRILPLIGGALSGSPDAYRYLPESVRRFPSAGELADGMRRAGFTNVSFDYLTAGIVALHLGQV